MCAARRRRSFPRGFFCVYVWVLHPSIALLLLGVEGQDATPVCPEQTTAKRKKKEKFSRRRRTAAAEASQNLFFFFLFTHLQLMDFLVYFLLLLHVWPAAHLNLGQLLGKQGRYDEAIHWLAACTQLDSSASVRDPQSHRHSQIQALILWGQMELSVRQQPARAVQLYKQALRRSPTNPQQLEVLHQKIQFNSRNCCVKPYNIIIKQLSTF